MFLSFLVSVPDCETILSPVYALLEARTQNYCQVLQLRGKLDMLLKQSDDKQTDNNLDVEQEALAGNESIMNFSTDTTVKNSSVYIYIKTRDS